MKRSGTPEARGRFFSLLFSLKVLDGDTQEKVKGEESELISAFSLKGLNLQLESGGTCLFETRATIGI